MKRKGPRKKSGARALTPKDRARLKKWIMEHVPLPEPIRPARAGREHTVGEVLDVIRWRSPRLHKGETLEELIRYRTAKNRVFFYPACGFDWEPLYRFAGECDRPVCDTFIYCDYAIAKPRFLAALDDLLHTQAGRRLQVVSCIDMAERSVNALLPEVGAPAQLPGGAPAVVPWGSLVRLTSLVGRPKSISLVYLGLEGVRLYETLFQRRKRAPEYLCIKQEGGGFGNGWTNFWDWTEPLARAVDQGRCIPKFVVVNRRVRDGYNWPWNVVAREFPVWHGDFGPPVFVYNRPEVQTLVSEREMDYLYID